MIRRVVTGQRNGRSVVVSDGVPARSHHFKHLPGMGYCIAWQSAATPALGSAIVAEPVDRDTTTLPTVGETRFAFLQIPPDGREPEDPAAFGAELMAHQPDILATLEPEAFGFHTSDTLDYAIVLEGQVDLELDDGEIVHLAEHDVVVQGGVRHCWRNRGATPALLAVVLVGGSRSS